MVKVLQQGGYVIYIHSGEGETEVQNLESCSPQSSPGDHSQIEIQIIGRSFLDLYIPMGQVLHSASCTSRDMAMFMFGWGENWADTSEASTSLRGERIRALRQVLSTKPQAGTNNVFVGHGLDITDVTGIAFGEHETGIFKPLGKTGYMLVARILPADWEELAPDAADQLQVESYESDSIPLEKIEPRYQLAAPLDSAPEENHEQNEAAPTDEDLLLPDLTTLPPTDLRIRVNPSDGHKLLRFTNSIMNRGPGKIELWGENNPASGKMTVTQHIYDAEGVSDQRVVGEFLFHPEHNHWHLGDFARYEIWSIGADGELDSVVAVSNKISYCLRDDARADIPGASARQAYISCNHEMQGISVGWIDIYRHHLPGQSIDINFLRDGVYALRSTVDPENSLWEENRENNTVILYIEIEGNTVRTVESLEILNEPLEN